MFRLSSTVVALAVFAVTQAPAAAAVANPASVHRRDQGGTTHIEDAFFNAGPSRVELALSDGRRLTLPQALSASGARYASADEGTVFWTKGPTAFVDEQGRQTYADCRTSR
ncbi:MAG TPA: MliC family protein [Rubrivivax sp.]|nr:MliC family protein [Rubrivivax sp.]